MKVSNGHSAGGIIERFHTARAGESNTMDILRTLSDVLGILLIVFILFEGFETTVLPRTVDRGLRLTRFLYKNAWNLCRKINARIPSPSRRDAFLGYFGPMSLLVLLFIWATGLVTGFALLQWGQGQSFHSATGKFTLLNAFYLSGTTFFTLGLGDITPLTSWARFVTVVESGVGFGFLAVTIGYLPILYQSFSRREVLIAMLDARAGTPPTGLELVRRASETGTVESLASYLLTWEQWSSELLESHLSYPVLSYYRSQHNGTSWLAALTAILDATTILKIGCPSQTGAQASLTYAMARHAAVDIALVFNAQPNRTVQRINKTEFNEAIRRLEMSGFSFPDVAELEDQFEVIRRQYEPYIVALSEYFLYPLPGWLADEALPDNWQTSPWDPRVERSRRHF